MQGKDKPKNTGSRTELMTWTAQLFKPPSTTTHDGGRKYLTKFARRLLGPKGHRSEQNLGPTAENIMSLVKQIKGAVDTCDYQAFQQGLIQLQQSARSGNEMAIEQYARCIRHLSASRAHNCLNGSAVLDHNLIELTVSQSDFEAHCAEQAQYRSCVHI